MILHTVTLLNSFIGFYCYLDFLEFSMYMMDLHLSVTISSFTSYYFLFILLLSVIFLTLLIEKEWLQ